MKPSKATCLILAALFAALLCGCGGGASHEAANTDLPSLPPTEPPTWMQTTDPRPYELGPDGYFSDDYITVNWPSFLKFDRVISNDAQYSGKVNGKKVVLSYVVDSGGSFEQELGYFDFDSYAEYLRNEINSYYVLKEFAYTAVDGHMAVRAAFDYDPPDEPEKLVHILQYTFNVKGWILGVTFTSQGDIPAECEESILSIDFKQ